jgi:DNA-binding SARP family transcriptional activator
MDEGADTRVMDGSLLPAAELGAPELLEDLVFGVALSRRGGDVVYLNRRARELLLPGSAGDAGAGLRCCDLICDHLEPVLGEGCLTERAAASAGQLPEVRMDIEAGTLQSAAWVTAARLDEEGTRVAFHLRPGQPGDRRRRTPASWGGGAGAGEIPELQISTLGRFGVEGASGPIGGDWQTQRPGQLLKYLICERRRVVTSDQIGETLWPEAGPKESANRLRFNVHALRDRLEPGRVRRAPARFVVASRGGYTIDTGALWLDADRFEVEALAGIAAAEQSLDEAAAGHLAEALRLYRGDFLAGDPYLDFAISERERLHELACRALRAQVRVAVGGERLDAAAAGARRLAEMEPFDADAQRLLIEVCLRRGRHSEAHRRFTTFAKQLAGAFGREPDFDLRQVERSLADAGPTPPASGKQN